MVAILPNTIYILMCRIWKVALITVILFVLPKFLNVVKYISYISQTPPPWPKANNKCERLYLFLSVKFVTTFSELIFSLNFSVKIILYNFILPLGPYSPLVRPRLCASWDHVLAEYRARPAEFHVPKEQCPFRKWAMRRDPGPSSGRFCAPCTGSGRPNRIWSWGRKMYV